jgi:hypothetical protein
MKALRLARRAHALSARTTDSGEMGKFGQKVNVGGVNAQQALPKGL